MSHRILQRPDGDYAVWSTVVDDFIHEDMSAEELEAWYVEKEAQKAREHIQERIESWEGGSSPYPSNVGPRTYEEAQEFKQHLAERE